MAALSLTMLESASELRVSGRLSAMEESARRTERRIFANQDAAARPTAYAGAVDALALGAATVAAILIGSAELAAGSLAPVELAIIALTPLAAFEATQPLGQAAVHSSARRPRASASSPSWIPRPGSRSGSRPPEPPKPRIPRGADREGRRRRMGDRIPDGADTARRRGCTPGA